MVDKVTLKEIEDAINLLPKQIITYEDEIIEMNEELMKYYLNKLEKAGMFLKFKRLGFKPSVKDSLIIDGKKVYCPKYKNFEGVTVIISEKVLKE